jgi:hypothetical protein
LEKIHDGIRVRQETIYIEQGYPERIERCAFFGADRGFPCMVWSPQAKTMV